MDVAKKVVWKFTKSAIRTTTLGVMGIPDIGVVVDIYDLIDILSSAITMAPDLATFDDAFDDAFDDKSLDAFGNDGTDAANHEVAADNATDAKTDALAVTTYYAIAIDALIDEVNNIAADVEDATTSNTHEAEKTSNLSPQRSPQLKQQTAQQLKHQLMRQKKRQQMRQKKRQQMGKSAANKSYVPPSSNPNESTFDAAFDPEIDAEIDDVFDDKSLDAFGNDGTDAENEVAADNATDAIDVLTDEINNIAADVEDATNSNTHEAKNTSNLSPQRSPQLKQQTAQQLTHQLMPQKKRQEMGKSAANKSYVPPSSNPNESHGPVILVGSEFTTPDRLYLTISQKFMSSDLTVTDKNENVMMTVKRNVITLRHRRTIFDHGGNPVVHMCEKLMSTHKRWQVFRGSSDGLENLLYEIKKTDVFQFRTQLQVFLAENTDQKDCDFMIKVSNAEKKWSICVGDSNNIIAQMEKEDKKKAAYQVTVNPNVDYAFVVSLIAILHVVDT